MYSHVCPYCIYPDTEVYHSTYLGHPITRLDKLDGSGYCWHSNSWQSDTLAELKRRIKSQNAFFGA